MSVTDWPRLDSVAAHFTQVFDVATRTELLAVGPMKDGTFVIAPNPITICVGKRHCVEVTVVWP